MSDIVYENKNTVTVEFWAPTSNHGKKALLSIEVGSNLAGGYNIPQKGEIVTLRRPHKKKRHMWRKVTKVSYDTRRDVFKVFINHTHNIKLPFDYEWIRFIVSLIETYDKSVSDFFKKWTEMVKSDVIESEKETV